MLIGIGADVTELARFRKIIQRASPLYFERLLSTAELHYFSGLPNEQRKVKWLAGAFAAKEAMLKASGRGIDGIIPLSSLCTLSLHDDMLMIQLPQAILDQIGVQAQCRLTLTYTKHTALAIVIIEALTDKWGSTYEEAIFA